MSVNIQFCKENQWINMLLGKTHTYVMRTGNKNLQQQRKPDSCSTISLIRENGFA